MVIAPAPLSVVLSAGVVAESGGGATAVRDATAPRDGAAAPPRCEYDPPLGAFMAHLGLLQHLPVLVKEELSLEVLRMMLSAGKLERSLTLAGLKIGARFKIEHGLRTLDGDGGGVAVGGARGGGPDADATTRGDAAAAASLAASTAAAAAAASTTPQWFADGNFEDIS